MNVGSGKEISIKNLIEKIISKSSSKKIEIKKDKKRVRPKKSEVNRLISSNKKAKNILKWSPKYSGKKGFQKGILETVEWFRNSQNLKYYKSDLYNL